MTTTTLRKLAPTLFILALAAFTSQAQAFQMPGCDALEQWASGYDPDQTVNLTPKVRVTSLLADETAEPLFGQSVLEWSAEDLATLRKGLNKCRKAAHKRKERDTSEHLYTALKAVDRARRPLRDYLRVKSGIARTVERLARYRPSPRLARQLALSQDALLGQGTNLSAHDLQQMPNWIPTFKQAPDYLTPAQIEGFVSALSAQQTEMEKGFGQAKKDFAAAKRELASAPLSADGMQTLDRLERQPWIKDLTPQEQDALRNEISRKRMQYAQTQLGGQQAQQLRPPRPRPPGTAPSQKPHKAAAGSPDLKAYLDEILVGDNVEDVTIKGLAPGVPEQRAIRHAKQRWGFKDGVTLSLRPAFGLQGSMTEFKSMDDGTVGEIDFTTRFKTPLNSQQALDTLKTRFGAPDKTESIPAGQRLTWHDGDRILQVVSANRVNHLYSGYKSRLAVALWTEEYEDYLEAVNDHCDELKEIPMNELSLAQKQYLAGHCSLLGNTHKTPGLEAAL